MAGGSSGSGERRAMKPRLCGWSGVSPIVKLWPRLEKGARLGDIGGERAPLEQQVRQDIGQALHPGQADRLRTGIDHACRQVILQILSDAWQVQRDGNAKLVEMRCGADA